MSDKTTWFALVAICLLSIGQAIIITGLIENISTLQEAVITLQEIHLGEKQWVNKTNQLMMIGRKHAEF